LTHALFERGAPAPSEIAIYAGPREHIEELLSKMKVEAISTKLRGSGAAGLN
jgi:hypothetical protein